MATLKKIYSFVGLAVILHFLITGYLMQQNYFSIQPHDVLVRMMLRANHIYILFSGLVLLLASYSLPKGNKNKLYFVAAIIMLLATAGINIAFYIDPIKHLHSTEHLFHRKLTGLSIQGCLVGTGLHIVLLIINDRYNIHTRGK